MTHNTYSFSGDIMKYPIRCEILDVTGREVFPGVMGKTPDKSKPHIGKRGLAKREGTGVLITLDDGSVLGGHECWWKPITEKE